MSKSCCRRCHRTGLDAGDWLLLLYLFKWAGFCTAPTWLFVVSWIGFAVALINNANDD